ncbi:MAG: hypothetical protein ACK5TG_17185 [Planctomyces sp.]
MVLTTGIGGTSLHDVSASVDLIVPAGVAVFVTGQDDVAAFGQLILHAAAIIASDLIGIMPPAGGMVYDGNDGEFGFNGCGQQVIGLQFLEVIFAHPQLRQIGLAAAVPGRIECNKSDVFDNASTDEMRGRGAEFVRGDLFGNAKSRVCSKGLQV